MMAGTSRIGWWAPAVAACLLVSGGGCTSSGGSVFYPVDFAPRSDGGTPTVDMSQGVSLDFAVVPPDLVTLPDLVPPPDLVTPPAGCASGVYVGSVSATGLGLTLTGPVTITLGPAQNGVLPVTQGTMTAIDANTGTRATASISGGLDCARRLFSGMLVNGNVAPFNLPFGGTLLADYDPGLRRLSNGVAMIPMLQGNGTWSADKQ